MRPLHPALLLPTALVAFLGVLAGATTAVAEPLRASDVTERGRDVDRILDVVLHPVSPPGEGGRALVFLLDVTESLRRSDFASELAAAMERGAAALAGTRIGIARTGAAGLVLRPTPHRDLVSQVVREALAKPDTSFQDVYGDLRRLLPDLRREAGTREVVLVTLENGDAESDVEQAARDLRGAGVRCSAIAREAFLSDTWWVLEPPDGPPGTRFTGSDAPWVDLPWGFRFQWLVGNQAVLSAFPMYGIGRLAAATGGRVFLYYPETGFTHACRHHPYSRCPFCEEDHVPPDEEIYQSQRLRALAPLVVSREEAMAIAAADPFHRALQRAWERASDQGLVFSRPSLEVSGGALRPERQPYRGWVNLGTTASFSSEASHAARLREDNDRVLAELEQDLERARAPGGGEERWLAAAETFALMLRIQRANLVLYEAFCEDTGPAHANRRVEAYAPPELAPYGDDPTFLAISFTNLSLCHGVEPFRRLRLPGGEATAREIDDLAGAWNDFQARWHHTPYAQVVRRMGLARFHLVKTPGGPAPGERRIPDAKKAETVTLPERPARPERPVRPGGTSGGGSGPASGG